MTGVRTTVEGRVLMVTIDRPETRNAVDPAAAAALASAFRDFDGDHDLAAAVLTGAGGTFCSGADLHALARGDVLPVAPDGDGPLGPTRMLLSKPVIAAIEGHAVAGGLELALWCDVRIAAESAVFGVFNRRIGVPLVDMGTVRLPRIVGHGRALEMILTGRPVGAGEAAAIGLVAEVVPHGAAMGRAVELAGQLASLPQAALRGDRLSTMEGWDLTGDEARRNEARRGLSSLTSGEAERGAARFAAGEGRGGKPVPGDFL